MDAFPGGLRATCWILRREGTRDFPPTHIKKKRGSNGLLEHFIRNKGTLDVRFSREGSNIGTSKPRIGKRRGISINVLICASKYWQILRDNNKLAKRDTVSIFKTERISVFTSPADMEVSRRNTCVHGVFIKRTNSVHGVTMFPDEMGFQRGSYRFYSGKDTAESWMTTELT